MLVADAARRENRTKSLRDDDDDVDLDDVDAFVEDDALCKGLHDDKAWWWWCEAEESVDGIIFFFFRGALIRSSFCRVLRASRGKGGGAFGVMAFCLSNPDYTTHSPGVGFRV